MRRVLPARVDEDEPERLLRVRIDLPVAEPLDRAPVKRKHGRRRFAYCRRLIFSLRFSCHLNGFASAWEGENPSRVEAPSVGHDHESAALRVAFGLAAAA